MTQAAVDGALAAAGERATLAKRAGGAIELAEISVQFGKAGREVTALQRVSLTIEPGQFVAVLGPSGCGKSTLLNVIAGFERPRAGSVRVDGELVTEPSPRRPVVFQQHSLFPWMTALDNVAFGLKMAGDAAARERARHYLALVGLSDFAEHYPEQLSGGMQQRVGIARALAVEPAVLLMDEPFGALDAQTRALMQEQLLGLWERWRHTVVFVTHDIDEAIFLADRVVVLGVKPNGLRRIVDVDVPRPRSPRARLDPTYQALYQDLFGLIRDESSKTFHGSRAAS
ncbi:ABC transporter ATP-binding protein [Sorangium sp. So ce124]|uniref:ABC transporter ATP-binding protein n=1 Tax=Sorangium sp. So ce124 TaxID=3133280 RepID=UPI003F62C0A5